MQNVGSTFLTMQSYGVTVIGAIIVVGGLIGVALAKTMKGKLIWGGIGLAGIFTIWGTLKVRTHITTNPESAGPYGTIALGLFALGGVMSILTRKP